MVKVGLRKPSIKKSVKARTTGKAKRALKKSINPTYGKKGAGWVKNPKKAAYNKVYNKTTKSITDFDSSNKRKSNSKTNYYGNKQHKSESRSGYGCWTMILTTLVILILIPFFPLIGGVALLAITIIFLIKLGSPPKQTYYMEQEEQAFSDDRFTDERWDDF